MAHILVGPNFKKADWVANVVLLVLHITSLAL